MVRLSRVARHVLKRRFGGVQITMINLEVVVEVIEYEKAVFEGGAGAGAGENVALLVGGALPGGLGSARIGLTSSGSGGPAGARLRFRTVHAVAPKGMPTSTNIARPPHLPCGASGTGRQAHSMWKWHPSRTSRPTRRTGQARFRESMYEGLTPSQLTRAPARMNGNTYRQWVARANLHTAVLPKLLSHERQAVHVERRKRARGITLRATRTPRSQRCARVRAAPI